MPKDIHLILIEDDTYARDLMNMLLTRDWRTRIVGEAGSEADVKSLLEQPFYRVDALVLDTEFPGDRTWPLRVIQIAKTNEQPPCILCTGTQASPEFLRAAVEEGLGGYVIKKEIRYSLAAAVSQAAKMNKFVITKSVLRMALRQRITLPDHTVLLDGTKPVADLTPRESEIARLAILFNHPHRDLSDELLIRSDQVSKHVSSVYKKLGLEEILNGEIEPEIYFQDKVVLQHFRQILTRVAVSKSRRKTADMATLAFHLLTQPEINEKPW